MCYNLYMYIDNKVWLESWVVIQKIVCFSLAQISCGNLFQFGAQVIQIKNFFLEG